MCILCVIQKWSRRVATMLPWLVIPLIALWALSQLLPPAFRFEITSSRLACVFVLLITLFWYEVLMPQLSAWRARRNARLRDRKRFEALELQKLRKTATRKCRNCLTPYRDQNPGGGKFMCAYCGHVSKRPVLDLAIPPGLGTSNSGIIKDLFGKGGKILNGKVSSDDASICPEWLEHGNWVVSGSFTGKSNYLRKSVGFFGANEQCLDEKSCPHAYIYPRKWLMSFLKSIRWLSRKLFIVSLSREDGMSEAEHRAMLAKRVENSGVCHESRGEKARRKAEEKRQARLEKELLEQEERKQREEVARLVEERRRLRDEILEAENRAKGLSSLRDIDKKEAEKKRQEKRKEKDKDKGSSKSNSDAEELEKKGMKENEHKRDTDKRNETEKRESQKPGMDNVKGQIIEAGQGVKSNSANISRVNAHTRYLDRMRGTFLSSSRALTGGSFFGKVSHTPLPVLKEKSNSSIDHFQVSANRRELCPLERVPPKVAASGDDKNINRPVFAEPRQKTVPKSWHHLFTKSPPVPAPSNANVISRPSAKSQAEVNNSQLPHQLPSPTTYDNPINFGFPSPFNLPTYSNGSIANMSGLSPPRDPMFPRAGDMSRDLLREEPELFEDPCYVPDPVSLLGPVSESLDNFQLDLGTGFIPEELDKHCNLMNVSASPETSRPSPIESPILQLRVSDERQNSSNSLPASPRFHDMHLFPGSDLNSSNETGTWQMWTTSPLGQDGLGLIGGPASWTQSLGHSRSREEEILQPPYQKTMASLFTKNDPVASGNYSPQKIFLGNCQNGGAFASAIPGPNDHDPWVQKPLFPPVSGGENHFPINHPVEDTHTHVVCGSRSRSAASNSIDLPPTSCWETKNERAMQSSGDEGVGDPSVMKHLVGGLFSTADVRSLWSFE